MQLMIAAHKRVFYLTCQLSVVEASRRSSANWTVFEAYHPLRATVVAKQTAVTRDVWHMVALLGIIV